MVKIKTIWICLLFISGAAAINAQVPRPVGSGEIHESIKKLNVLASILYVAAHPDDENTQLISYMANERKANVAYLSMTRGDGGQNLIGPEIAELLGLLRTQELLAARRIDGGNQMFTRANDFGFSKHPEETLNVWNKDEMLSDVIWAIRKWQPDIVINRFWHEYEEALAGRMHGHHTASAQLSYEAFELANRKDIYPDQLKSVQPWQPKRLFFNFYTWMNDNRQADPNKMMSVDVGTYFPARGLSNSEIAAMSRSMHKCQGFGVPLTRGTRDDRLLLLKGDMPTDKTDPFAGINTSWTRVQGGAPIGQLIEKIISGYRFDNPAASVPQLVTAYNMINNLPDQYWKRVKLVEVKQIIQQCMGLYMEAAASEPSATPGEPVQLNLEVTNRSAQSVQLRNVHLLPMQKDTAVNQELDNNKSWTLKYNLNLPVDLPITNAYWLNEDHPIGRYRVDDQMLRGLPETPRQFQAAFDLEINGTLLTYVKDVMFKKTDPVDGEVHQPFEVTPPVFANIKDKVYVFAGQSPQTVEVVIKSGAANLSGSAALKIPADWKVEPATAPFNLALKGAEQVLSFTVFPPENATEGIVEAVATVNGVDYSKNIYAIEYKHIPTQTILRPSTARVVRLDLRKAGEKVAYIMGAGDDIPASLRQVGYQVDVLSESNITLDQLRRYDALIMGVRAYNTVERLKFVQPVLMDYVRQGGVMIVQYNTNGRDLVLPNPGPYPLELSRDRVTVEEAEIRLLHPDHPILNIPNKITAEDFKGWVQERGLYFPNQWDEHYQALLSCNDPGETPKDGGLLVAQYGEGTFIYTGYSWFRQLPAGVPGAYRLFVNLISAGKTPKP